MLIQVKNVNTLGGGAGLLILGGGGGLCVVREGLKSSVGELDLTGVGDDSTFGDSGLTSGEEAVWNKIK